MRCLVTGGNGHLGINLVRTLVDRGYRVRATVRSLTDPAKTAALHAMPSVELRAGDIRDEVQMRAAMADIDTLFHVAAVYSLTDRRRATEIVDTAVRGTEVVLRAAAASGVRRVVMTSSVVTLPLTARGAPPATERDWTTDLRVPYMRAKTESERRAWQLADELGLELTTILPAGIIGPGFTQPTPTIDIVEAAWMGEFRLGAPDGNFTFVDARDVAEAHVLAAERAVGGRFIVGYDVAPSFDGLVRALAKIDPDVKPPLMVLPVFMAPILPLVDAVSHVLVGTPRIANPELIASAVSGRVWNCSNERARKELGWAPRVSFEDSLRETLELIRARRAP